MAKLPTSLERLVLMLRNDQAEIADRLPSAKRVELASGILTVRSVDIADPVPPHPAPVKVDQQRPVSKRARS